MDTAAFRLEHLHPERGRPVDIPREPPHCLHAIRGSVIVTNTRGGLVGELAGGESALVPVGVGPYRMASGDSGAEIIKVSFPM